MSLIKSISGIRGTIGGQPGGNLTPPDIVRFVSAYAVILQQDHPHQKISVIIGRDSRISGEMIDHLAIGILISFGIEVIDLGLAAAPTVEIAVLQNKAQGGIIITASHNPQGWNALKLLNERGDIFSAAEGEKLNDLVARGDFNYLPEDKLGQYEYQPELGQAHLGAIADLFLVDKIAIAARRFKIVVDGINSAGGVVVPQLLKILGVTDIVEVNCEPTGLFAHQPEPLEQNLTQICETVKKAKADLGIVVDPDVDRLAFINERGEMISEEYTIVAAVDYVFKNFDQIEANYPGQYTKITTSNLSSSRALPDVAEKHGGHYEVAAVGEINVVEKMKGLKAVIGGEGNGGVIYAPLHYGRDALIGIALILSALAQSGKKISEYKNSFPEYFLVKDKMELTTDINLAGLLVEIKRAYATEKVTDIDGVRIDWPESWVHLRGSNTEPIMRIYAEAKSAVAAQAKVDEMKSKILAYIKGN